MHLLKTEVNAMRYPAKETAKKHDVLIQKASEMFRERGFESVSVAEAMKAAGLTHGAFYSHFGSKTDLMRAATEQALEKTRARVARNFQNPADQEKYIESYLGQKHCRNVAGGCPLAALSGELRKEPELQEMFARKLEEIIEATGETRDEAIMTLSTMVGAMSLARAVGEGPLSAEILKRVRTQMKSRLKRVTKGAAGEK
jgi:TetR/AcrR family transcriptional regulator, transcriptional repressor for nem operon